MRSVSRRRLPADVISLQNIRFQLTLAQLSCDIQKLIENKFIYELNQRLLNATVSPGNTILTIT